MREVSLENISGVSQLELYDEHFVLDEGSEEQWIHESKIDGVRIQDNSKGVTVGWILTAISILTCLSGVLGMVFYGIESGIVVLFGFSLTLAFSQASILTQQNVGTRLIVVSGDAESFVVPVSKAEMIEKEIQQRYV